MILSDLHEPFSVNGGVAFCKAVQKEFKIPPWHVYASGDETDHYFGSRYEKDPDGWYTANSELKATCEKLRAWYRAFPMLKLAISNHGLRWAKRAYEAEIPSQMLKPYQELIEAPVGWQWKYEWRVKTAKPFRLIHGMGYSGQQGHVNAAIDGGESTVIGHLHSFGGATHIRRSGLEVWGLNVGCLIDAESYAFHYGREMRNKPTLGVGVVLDGGRTPLFVPYQKQ